MRLGMRCRLSPTADVPSHTSGVADGKTLASPKAVPAGTDVRTLKDATGNAYGLAIYAAAQKPEGQITELQSYMFPKPGTTTPMFPKVSFVTKVGELGCGVGYYK